MHLSLSFPTSAWTIKQAPDDQFAAILPGPPGNPPEAIVTYGPLVVKPDEPRPWMEQVARSDAPRGSRVTLGDLIEMKTATGWPLRLLEVAITTANDEPIELRLCAFYTFFEHAAAAIVRAGDRARLELHGKAILEILQTGCPDWRGEPIALAELWDLEPKQRRAGRLAVRGLVGEDPELAAALAEIDAAIAAGPDAAAYLRRGQIQLAQGRPADALAAFDAAIALDARSEAGHHLRGVALGELGRHADALAAWQRVLELAPDRIDTLYNVAQAQFLARNYEQALASFRRLVELDPDDFMLVRKVAQCFYALGRYDEGQQARIEFRTKWSTTSDPRARMISEFVFDQFEADGFWVHAVETLQARNPAFYPVLTFRAMHMHGDHDHPLPATVLVETSDQAQAAGTPFVLAVVSGQQYRVIGAAKELGPYAQLKADVIKLLRDALANAR